MAIQRRIRSSEHEAAAALVDAEEIAVPPHAGKILEIGLRDNARRPGRSRSTSGIDGIGSVMTISPTSSTTLRPFSSNACSATPSCARLDLAGIHRLDHDAAAESAADIRSAAAG